MFKTRTRLLMVRHGLLSLALGVCLIALVIVPGGFADSKNKPQKKKLMPSQVTARLMSMKGTGSQRVLKGPWLDLGQAMFIQGPQDAKVVLVVFMDFQSEASSLVAKTLAEIRAEAPQKTRLEFHHFSNERVFSLQKKAASAAVAAGMQDKFWQYHDLLYKNRTSFSPALFISLGRQLGLDEKTFTQHLADPWVIAAVENDCALAQTLGLTRPPSLFVNGYRMKDQALAGRALKRVVYEHLSGQHKVSDRARGIRSRKSTR